MEQELANLLAETQSNQETPRKQAELRLKQLYHDPSFPFGLVSLATSDAAPIPIRQAALLVCGKFVETSWSPSTEDFQGQVLIDDHNKSTLRDGLLSLALSEHDERKIKSAASLVVSKIAVADFDDWPDLMPRLLEVLPSGADGQLHGALKVLQDLVDDCLGEEQFFKVARDLINALHQVATNENRRPNLRALALSVFRSTFDTLEMILEEHKAAVKGFAEETINGWIPFFKQTIESDLPVAADEGSDTVDKTAEEFLRGTIALKLQVIKLLVRIRQVFPSVLAPDSLDLFSAVWQDLIDLQPRYRASYIEDDRQGRLEDGDGLPFSLDFLVLEELDFMQSCLRAAPVKKQLSQSSDWSKDIIALAVTYAHITVEEEGIWEFDVNIFLSEESNITANYTPRTACGDLMVRLEEWKSGVAIGALLQQAQAVQEPSWKSTEATLYLLNGALRDLNEIEKMVAPDLALSFIDILQKAIHHDEALLRARCQLVMGSLLQASGQTLLESAPGLLASCLSTMSGEEPDIVKVASVRALQQYLSAIPPTVTLPLQSTIILSLASFLAKQDLSDLSDNEDIMMALLETLRDALLLDTRICLQGTGLELLFAIASQGAASFQIIMLITETFEEVVGTLAATGSETYAQLCNRVLPSLIEAFHVATLTEENALTNLAAEMLGTLAVKGPSPLPQGFTNTVMPKMEAALLHSTDDELLKAATVTTQYIVEQDAEQVFAWTSDGKSGVEVLLTIIDRLLNGGLDDNAASEVGGLAGAVVDKAGSERLGPYLPQLLTAVAMRLSKAEKTQIIQSLILVFARLITSSANEVIEFLQGIHVDGRTGLQVVVTKWLENSVHFAGYEDIRENVSALTRLYNLHTPYLASISVKGDQIIPQNASRIVTRSRAKATPTQYTTVPADVKILKLLVTELLDASGQPESEAKAIGAAAITDEEDHDSDEDDEEWEDDPHDFLDLGSGMTKESLMRFGEGDRRDNDGRVSDDETQAFLTQWFRTEVTKPGFEEMFSNLNEAEQAKLRQLLS